MTRHLASCLMPSRVFRGGCAATTSPGSRYLQFERLGHTPNWDDPELVASLLLEASAALPAEA